MRMASLLPAAALAGILAAGGCASRSPDAARLSSVAGVWGSSSPRGGVVYVSAIQIQTNGTFTMQTAVVGAAAERNLLAGICRPRGDRMTLRVEISQHPLGVTLPLELEGEFADGCLLLRDNPGDRRRVTRYRRMAPAAEEGGAPRTNRTGETDDGHP
jgi:hypothetical protein